MSGDLEKFVLQYNVDLRDSIDRLERLNQRIEQTNKNASQSSAKLKAFGKDAFSEVSKLAPELARATAGAFTLTTGLLGVGAALTVIAGGVKAIIDLRKEYDAQRSTSFLSGMSVQQIEQFQRTSARTSRLGAQGSRDLLGKISGMAMSAYTNVDPMSREQMMLRTMGTSAFEGGHIKDTMKILDEISKKMQSVSKETAYAMGQAAGLTHDEVDAIRKRTDTVKKSTEMTKADQALQQQGIAALETLNQKYNILTDKLRQSGNVLGAQLLPYLSEFIDWITEIADKLPNLIHETMNELKAQFKASMKNMFEFDNWGEKFDKTLKEERQKIKEDEERRAKINNNAANEARNQQATFSRDINLFSAAVSTFAGVIDERQAWAAWAGEVGRNAGVGAGGEGARSTGARFGMPAIGPQLAPAQYDQLINKYATDYGVDPNIMKKLFQGESNFNPNAVGQPTKYGTAVGLGQILPSNFAHLGITNGYDPEQNIRGATQLFSEYLAKAGGDVRTALKMYHGGPNSSIWGAKTEAYPDYIMKQNVNYGQEPYAAVKGDTRGDVQKRLVQDAIAKNLNVPIEQLQLGGVNQGDIHFTRAKLESQMIREVQQKELLATAPGIRPMEQAKAYQDLKTAQMNLRALQKYGREIELGGRSGGRDITLQEKAIFIQVDGAGDPLKVANEVVSKLYSVDLSDIVNGSTSAVKY